MADVIRTIVVDDHPLFRGGVIQTLDAERDIRVVGEGASADDAERLVAEQTPDVALLDISMPGDGHAVVPSLRRMAPGLRIAMLTSSEDDGDVRRALANGADGYILKGVGGGELANVVRVIADGKAYVSPTLAARLLSEPARDRQPAPDPLAELSHREEEILTHVSRGLTNKEVARTLDLQEKTIKHYMTIILQKLNVRNRTEAALIVHDRIGSYA